MGTAHDILFRPFRLDLENEILWRGSRILALRQKSFALLRYLAERPGELVCKEELLKAVWPETRVSDIVLKVCIREVRQILGDQPQTPSYIETVQRRGYRFIRPVRIRGLASGPRPKRNQQTESEGRSPGRSSDIKPLEPPLALPLEDHQDLVPNAVGRVAELQQLQSYLEKAWRGTRQVVFLSGEAGIGKTTLIEAFLQNLESRVQSLASESQTGSSAIAQTLDSRRWTLDARPWIARGQCIAHYGVGEAYLPVIEAVSRLCREPAHEHFLTLLNRYAPMWLAQMPSLLSPHSHNRLQREIRGATQERMLRELAEALEALTAEVPLVLILEDLHWSDYATLDLLSFLATRQEPARLLILASYRPEELDLSGHPLKSVTHELQSHGRCHHLAIPLLTLEAISQYLHARFPGNTFSAGLARTIHQCTEGNPFFMTSLIEHLVTRRALTFQEQQWTLTMSPEDIQLEKPTNSSEIIEHQLARVNPQEELVLKAASVAGVEFSTAAVAAGLNAPVEEVEECCERLARRNQFLRAQGVDRWTTGTVAARYRFIHALYQQAWYERVTAARRAQLHQRIGEQKEQCYGDQAYEMAAELAPHFEQGRDVQRAIHYRRQAAKNATQRCGYHEAINHLSKGLTLLPQLPNTHERVRQEIALQSALGAAYMATQGYASPTVAHTYGRAIALYQSIEVEEQLAPALRGLWEFYLTRAELQTARTLAEQLLNVAHQTQNQASLLEAERVLGQTLYFLGEFAEARLHLEQSIKWYDPKQHADHALLYGQDPKVVCLAQNARALCLLGCSDQARQLSQEAIFFAHESAHPFSLALAQYNAAVVAQTLGDWRRAQDLTEATFALSATQGFPYWQFSALALYGWTLVQQGRLVEGINQMHKGLEAYAAIGASLNRPYALTLLAEVYSTAGRATEGLALLTEALACAHHSGGNFYQAEMLRLQGELTLQQYRDQATGNKQREGVSDPQPLSPNLYAEAEACFQQAIALAHQQGAKLLELRASVSLCRLWRNQGKCAQARQLLMGASAWESEGVDTVDRQAAKALLSTL